jgi:hypothetical protein
MVRSSNTTVIGGGGWEEWSNHVLLQLQDLNQSSRDMAKELGALKTEIALLKVKASLWGGLAGCVPTAVAVIWQIAKHT